jgi:hypothetical protein
MESSGENFSVVTDFFFEQISFLKNTLLLGELVSEL